MKKYLLIVIAAAFTACSTAESSTTQTAAVETVDLTDPRIMKIDSLFNQHKGKAVFLSGFDKASGTTIQEINIWRDYESRSSSFALENGDVVTLIGQDPTHEGLKIRDKEGNEGFVTYYFVEEFKEVPEPSF